MRLGEPGDLATLDKLLDGALGATEKASELVRELPFAARTSMLVFDLKLAVLTAIFVFAFFRFTPVGKAIRACADNYTGALVVGLDVKLLYALSFGLGAACVGAAGRRGRARRLT